MVHVEFHSTSGSRTPPESSGHSRDRATHGGDFAYVPILLGGVFQAYETIAPPRESLAGIKKQPEYERLEIEQFIRRHGIARFQLNPFFPVTP